MRLLCLSRYGPQAASSRLRVHQYLPMLAREGFRTEVFELLGDAYIHGLYAGRRNLVIAAHGYMRQSLRVAAASADRVLLEKELFPWLPVWVDRAMLPRLPYVLDLDDAIFHNYDNRAARLMLGGKIETLMARAAVVSAGNAYLAERARSAGAREVAVVPTSVDADRYCAGPFRESGRLTIGWIGTPVTQMYLKDIAPVLREAVRRLGVRIVLVGATNEARTWFPCDVRGWRESMEVDDIQDFDIGVMPLRDEPWERGKCGYKLIQYMACARPVIASPVGVNVTLTSDGATGLLASDEAGWYSAIERLVRDAPMRREMGLRARALVEERYSTQATGPRLARILRDLKAA